MRAGDAPVHETPVKAPTLPVPVYAVGIGLKDRKDEVKLSAALATSLRPSMTPMPLPRSPNEASAMFSAIGTFIISPSSRRFSVIKSIPARMARSGVWLRTGWPPMSNSPWWW